LEIKRLNAGNVTAALKHLGLDKADFVKIFDMIPDKVLFETPDQTIDAEK
jgi:hypothetical protein